MTPEQAFYSSAKKGLGKIGHLDRVENSIGSGMPDVNFAFRGTECWLELKVAKGGYLHFRIHQIPWMRSRIRHCPAVWVLAMCGKSIHLVHPSTIELEDLISSRDGVMLGAKLLRPSFSSRSDHPDWEGLASHMSQPPDVYNTRQACYPVNREERRE